MESSEKSSVYDTAQQHRLPCLSYLLSPSTYRNHLPRDPHAIYSCLSLGGSQAELQARAVQFRSSCHQPPPLHDGHICLESCCEPVIVQGWFASEIKEASAFWKKILGHIACHFRMALQVQHFLSSAITASFCVQFK